MSPLIPVSTRNRLQGHPWLVGCLLLLSAASASAYETDHKALMTDRGALAVTPIDHASLVLQWNGQTMYVDPTGKAGDYKGLPAPTQVLMTHAHHDHLSPDTLNALDLSHATLVLPASVSEQWPGLTHVPRQIIANDEDVTLAGIGIHAMPMYNLPQTLDSRHPKGWGDGYVLTLGNKRVYISGDTEGTTEMRSLKDIDLAFVCMNLPYTMSVAQAADAVLAFKPAVVYPYHYRGQDVGDFQRRVEAGNSSIDVRLRDWYPSTDAS